MKHKKPMAQIRLFVHNDYKGTFPVDLDWGKKWIISYSMDFLDEEDFVNLENLEGKFYPDEEKVVFTLKEKNMMTQRKQEVVKYPCPICKVELRQYEGSGIRRAGFSLYCSNIGCAVEEVTGYGRDLDHAYKIILDKFKNFPEQDAPPQIKEEVKTAILYGKAILDKDSKLCYD